MTEPTTTAAPTHVHHEVRLRHLPALDGLRGAAVVGVLAYHLGWIHGGFLGVDLFFVLSGFLITTLLVTEWAHDGAISFGSFWARRARRLLPALFLLLFGVAVYAALVAGPLELDRIRSDGIATLLYVANWHSIAAGTGYFDQFRVPSPLQHTWSLAIEEQFYLLWPLVVAGVLRLARSARSPRAGTAAVAGISAVLAVASATALVLLHHTGDSPDRVYYGTDTRAAAVLFGATLAAAVATWGHVHRPRARTALEAAAVLCSGLLLAAWWLARGSSAWLYEGGFAVLGIAAAVVVAAAVNPHPGVVGRALSWRPLCVLGLVSYGLYLWHWPVFVWLNPVRTGLDGLPLAALRLAVTAVPTVLSYRFVELPIRQRRLPDRVALPLAGATAVAIVAALVATTALPDTALARTAARVDRHPEKLTVARDASTTTVPGRLTVLEVGDSGAYFLGEGMALAGPGLDMNVVNRGTVGCGLGRGDNRTRLDDGSIVLDPPGCHDYLDRWTGYLDEFHPDVVVLTLAAPGSGKRWIANDWRADCDPVFDRWYTDEATVALQQLGRTGAKVVITTAPYYISPTTPDAFRKQTDCRNRTYRQAARAVPGTRVVDLAEWACPKGECIERRNGVTLRPDGLHFIDAGAVVAARWLLPRLRA